jgi:CubicO group peptidase (beta-lactamase class C family)
MTHTFFENRDSIVPETVAGYQQTDAGKYIEAPFEDQSWSFGCGGINSTVDDMLKWDNALYTDLLLGPEWRAKAFTAFSLPNGQNTHYGAGFGVTDRNGIQFIEHGGSQHGFESDILRIPNEHMYIIVLSNNENANLYSIPGDVAVRMLNIHMPKPAGKYPVLKALAQDTGAFLIHHMNAHVTWNFTPVKQLRTIFIKGDSLYAKATAEEYAEALLFISEDLFTGLESGMMYHFIRNKKRKVISLEYFSEPLRYGPDDIEIKE